MQETARAERNKSDSEPTKSATIQHLNAFYAGVRARLVESDLYRGLTIARDNAVGWFGYWISHMLDPNRVTHFGVDPRGAALCVVGLLFLWAVFA